MSTKLTSEFNEVGGRILLPIAAGVIVALAMFNPQIIAIILVLTFLVGWIYLVDRDYVLALTVFMALMPLWLFLKWVEWPSMAVGGGTIHLATMLKEVFMIVFFCHWLVSAVRNDQAIIQIPVALLGFFGFIAVALLQGELTQYPILLRPYLETFLLVAVPLLSIELDRRDIERLLIGVAVGGGITAVVALFHVFVDPEFLLWDWLIREEIFKTRGGLSAYFGPRLQSFTGNPNNLGRMMLLTAVVSFGFAFKEPPQDNLRQVGGYGGLFVMSTVVLMLTRSRDDIAFLAVAIAIFVIIQRRALPLVIGAAIFALGVLINLDQIVGTFETLLTQGNPRFKAWVSGIQFYGWELLTGVGLVNNKFVRQSVLDSTYFRILLQVGVFGLAAFLVASLLVVFGLVRQLYHCGSYLTEVVFVFVVTLLGTFVFTVNLFIFPFSLYYWFALAIAIRLTSDVWDTYRSREDVSANET